MTKQKLSAHTHLGEELSLRRRVLRWKRDGARQTARLVGVIWFSDTLAVTSLSRHSSVRRASRLSSGSSSTAARAACRRSSLGMSAEEEEGEMVSTEYNIQVLI